MPDPTAADPSGDPATRCLGLLAEAVALAETAAALAGTPSPAEQQLRRMYDEWADTTLRVAVVGASSTGKSTLLQHLFGPVPLPTGRTATTAALTVLRHGPAAEAQVHLRTSLTIDADAVRSGGADDDVRKALSAWCADPDAFGLLTATHTDGRTSVPVTAADLDLSHRTGRIDVTFAAAAPLRFDLTCDDGVRGFAAAVTDPVQALRVSRAVCRLPHPRLDGVTVIDTAGFSSPSPLHDQLSAELLQRRPDVLVVLLDARRPDSPPSHDTLAAVRPVLAADPHARLVVGLTHADRALRSHLDDLDVDVGDVTPDERATLIDDFVAVSRSRAETLLGADLATMPVVVPLALSPQAPPELRHHVEHLWKQVERLGGVGVGHDTWLARARAAGAAVDGLARWCDQRHQALLPELADLHRHADEVRQRGRSNRAGHLAARTAVSRAAGSIRAAVISERTNLLSDIDQLRKDRNFSRYLTDAYPDALHRAVNSIRAVAEAHHTELGRRLIVPGLHRPVLLEGDRLRPDARTAAAARRRIKGMRHRMRQGWSLALGSIADLAARDLAAARAALSHHAYEQLNQVGRHLEHWVNHLNRLLAANHAAVQQHDRRHLAELRDVVARIELTRQRADQLRSCARDAEALRAALTA
ncbi:dynamin family protein [Dactylosporangium aurantiacum]|uniref:Dynamin family protein n=1 Tax=Dactylosporangium aurantiacum TaxID=35754 RepID=A0A9Q9MIE2_9ACTN|nr:dynamin family protein [Dactylosporangium aurantiacum]MDG6106730.1 dynamin family protein [Dactylosporangium aurantiacum]UWZ50877.1 dynamin family protein [Dactylosporangium aurantiacum]